MLLVYLEGTPIWLGDGKSWVIDTLLGYIGKHLLTSCLHTPVLESLPFFRHLPCVLQCLPLARASLPVIFGLYSTIYELIHCLAVYRHTSASSKFFPFTSLNPYLLFLWTQNIKRLDSLSQDMVELRKRKAPAQAPAPERKVKKVQKSTISREPDVPKGSSNDKAPKVGDKLDLDNFGGDIETNDGQKTTLKDLVDASKAGVVLFTYPRASTPGCTWKSLLPYLHLP